MYDITIEKRWPFIPHGRSTEMVPSVTFNWRFSPPRDIFQLPSSPLPINPGTIRAQIFVPLKRKEFPLFNEKNDLFGRGEESCCFLLLEIKAMVRFHVWSNWGWVIDYRGKKMGKNDLNLIKHFYGVTIRKGFQCFGSLNGISLFTLELSIKRVGAFLLIFDVNGGRVGFN